MALDKAILSGKEHRKPYRRSKRFDKSCRNHGGCPWCLSNRLHNSRKREEKVRCCLIESDLLYNIEFYITIKVEEVAHMLEYGKQDCKRLTY